MACKERISLFENMQNKWKNYARQSVSKNVFAQTTHSLILNLISAKYEIILQKVNILSSPTENLLKKKIKRN